MTRGVTVVFIVSVFAAAAAAASVQNASAPPATNPASALADDQRNIAVWRRLGDQCVELAQNDLDSNTRFKIAREAAMYYEAAAAAGSPEAMYNLAELYRTSIFVFDGTNFDKAYPWYRKAAEAGSPEAMFKMWALLGAGKGVAKNVRLAAQWHEKAKSAGYHPAEYESVDDSLESATLAATGPREWVVVREPRFKAPYVNFVRRPMKDEGGNKPADDGLDEAMAWRNAYASGLTREAQEDAALESATAQRMKSRGFDANQIGSRRKELQQERLAKTQLAVALRRANGSDLQEQFKEHLRTWDQLDQLGAVERDNVEKRGQAIRDAVARGEVADKSARAIADQWLKENPPIQAESFKFAGFFNPETQKHGATEAEVAAGRQRIAVMYDAQVTTQGGLVRIVKVHLGLKTDQNGDWQRHAVFVDGAPLWQQ